MNTLTIGTTTYYTTEEVWLMMRGGAWIGAIGVVLVLLVLATLIGVGLRIYFWWKWRKLY